MYLEVRMKLSFSEITGQDPTTPEAVAAREDFNEFADVITALYRARKVQGITQSQVAKTMETKQSAISEIERIGGNPTIRTLLSYSRAVGMRLRLVADSAPDEHPPTADVHTGGSDIDHLLAEAQRLTGICDQSALVTTALTCLIERESAQRLARLDGAQPKVVVAPRRRESRTG